MVVGLNAGSHAAPAFAGDTIAAWSEVLVIAEVDAPDVAAIRLRTVAYRPDTAEVGALKDADGKYRPGVLLDLDYWALMPA